MPRNPWKSTTTKWSIWMPVSCSTWRTVQAGPPTLNASFHIVSVAPGIGFMSSSKHSGRLTSECAATNADLPTSQPGSTVLFTPTKLYGPMDSGFWTQPGRSPCQPW